MKFLSIFSIAIPLSMSLVACGDDSSSDSWVSTKSSTPASSASWADDETKDSSAIGDSYESNMGTTAVFKGEVVDSALDITYKTIQFGAYVWMAENAVVETDGSTSDCYNQDDSKCKTYGRLYKPSKASYACPSGFHLPSKADFEYLNDFAGNLYSSDLGFNLKMGGMCVDSLDKLVCSNVDKSAYLLTKSVDILQVARGGKVSYGVRNSDALYSVRCVKYNYIVDSRKFLPICNLSTEKDLGDFYVAEEGSNYRCNGQGWISREDKACRTDDKGRRFYYKDSLFVCDKTWQLAEMDNSLEVCADSIQWEERRLNGVRYVCEDSTWRKFTAIEDSLGICSSKMVGTSDSISLGSYYSTYTCDSTGWREITLAATLGTCDSSKMFQKASYKGDSYVCRVGGKWTPLSSVEKEIGICTKDLQGKLDTIEGTSFGYMVCDSLSWRYATMAETFGACNSDKHYDVVEFEGDTLVCRKNNTWEKMTSQEAVAGVCTPKRQGEMDTLKSVVYVCDTSSWRKTVLEDYIGKCDAKSLYKVTTYKDTTYGCDKKYQWKQVTGIVAEKGYCTFEVRQQVVTYGGKQYICDTTWRIASNDEIMGACNPEKDGDTVTIGRDHYVCSTTKWRAMSSQEYSMGIPCTKSTEDSVITRSGNDYICKNDVWRKHTIEDVHDSCTAKRYDEIVEFKDKKYVCGKSGWAVYSSLQDELGYCGADDYGQGAIDHNENIYVCVYGTWQRKSEVRYYLGNKCISGTLDTLITSVYYCSGNSWFPYTKVEETLGLCSMYNVGKAYSVGDSDYVCMFMSNDTYGYRAMTKADTALGICDGKKRYWVRHDGVDYSCGYRRESRKGWVTSTVNFNSMYETCFMDESMYNTTVGFNGKLYYCHDDLNSITDTYSGWHEITPVDEVDGVCTEERLDDLIQFNNHTYVCRKDTYYHWSVKPDAVASADE